MVSPGEKLELLLGESLLEVRFKNQGSDNEYWLVEKWKCLPIECAQEHDLSPYFRMGEHCGRAVNSVVTGLSQNYELEETLVASTVRRLWLVDGNPSRMPPDWMEKLEKVSFISLSPPHDNPALKKLYTTDYESRWTGLRQSGQLASCGKVLRFPRQSH